MRARLAIIFTALLLLLPSSALASPEEAEHLVTVATAAAGLEGEEFIAALVETVDTIAATEWSPVCLPAAAIVWASLTLTIDVAEGRADGTMGAAFVASVQADLESAVMECYTG